MPTSRSRRHKPPEKSRPRKARPAKPSPAETPSTNREVPPPKARITTGRVVAGTTSTIISIVAIALIAYTLTTGNLDHQAIRVPAALVAAAATWTSLWTFFDGRAVEVVGWILSLALTVTPLVPAAEPPKECERTGEHSERTPTLSTTGPFSDKITVSELHYALDSTPEGQFSVVFAGRIEGHIPDGKTLYQVGRPDPLTTDRFDNPGNGNFYPGLPIYPDKQGCWKLPERRIGYPGVYGIIYVSFIVLADDATVQAFNQFRQDAVLHSDTVSNGISPTDFEAYGTDVIASFRLPTAADDLG